MKKIYFQSWNGLSKIKNNDPKIKTTIIHFDQFDE